MKTAKQRRDFAAQLAAERSKLSDAQQIAKLDKRLGRNVGAKRERVRLTTRIVTYLLA